MINVTKTFLPTAEEYTSILARAWDKAWITNNGELVLELEAKLKEYLGVKHFNFTANGTIVLQMALKALNITKEVITTPFSYVATVNAIMWEGCSPVFVDIDPKTFCIDPQKIEDAVTENTEAILVTHVYGLPCDVEAIGRIARKYNLKVVYDGAHAFGTRYKNRSLLSYGDISTCSFHATKVFHTVEGGCIIVNEDEELAEKVLLYRQFGHIGEDYFSVGINAKNSEFHAAMGLANLNYLDAILHSRKEQWHFYKNLLGDKMQTLNADQHTQFNHSYFPVVFPSEECLLGTLQDLNEMNIFPRRYFFPSLNTLPFVKYQACPVSESIASRVLCLPLFFDLKKSDQQRIAETVLNAQKEIV